MHMCTYVHAVPCLGLAQVRIPLQKLTGTLKRGLTVLYFTTLVQSACAFLTLGKIDVLMRTIAEEGETVARGGGTTAVPVQIRAIVIIAQVSTPCIHIYVRMHACAGGHARTHGRCMCACACMCPSSCPLLVNRRLPCCCPSRRSAASCSRL